ncbi:DUF1707 domain-containing protein [Rhodococcus sp. IEGM 1408]|uniref:DUF1707 SHOCT-like domain-containing protein n=1 Tax=Rhodococcus sp. IEGM 1408 TaxID=3082220 RepID=UPI002952DC55|nr:DUF1707 domain-containing protein [Rhodococcus sp. IEGM 1408]MDV8001626.1 DUF1707 domain-containing protein [Rhodococcus sp. IEGM 1408]
MDDGPPDPDSHLPSLRASDAEREATARFLQDSYAEGRLTLAEFDERTARVYAARFRSDLAEITRDLPTPRREFDALPGAGLGAHPGIDSPESPLRRITGGSGPATSLAILGGSERKGVWTVPAEHTAFALMGGIQLDLRAAGLQAHETTIRAFAIMGGIEIIVPDDIHLEVEGLGLMGGFGEESGAWKSDPRPVRQAPPGAPRVRVTGLALMGGIGVRRVPRRAE